MKTTKSGCACGARETGKRERAPGEGKGPQVPELNDHDAAEVVRALMGVAAWVNAGGLERVTGALEALAQGKETA